MREPADTSHLIKRFTTIFPVGARSWSIRALSGWMVGMALLAGGALPALADDEPGTYQAPAFVELGVVNSRPEEAQNDFLMRVARVLDRFTRTSGHEACGAIMASADNTRWRVRLITNRSQLGCVRMMFDEPGFVLTPDTIHSHPLPNRGRLYANARDQVLRGFRCGTPVIVHDESFSKSDVANSRGYLVAQGQLLRLKDDVVSQLGTIDLTAPIDGLVSMPNATGRTTRQVRALAVEATPAVWSKHDAEGLPILGCKAARQASNAAKTRK